MDEKTDYEIVVGLEVHAQLLTLSKLFSGDRNLFAGEANTHVSAITLAHPGTLPKLNKSAIGLAVKMGLACACEITRSNHFARKNYFYPDLPKGYQLSQHTTPICRGGHVQIETTSGVKSVRLQRIHMEEDAGKSIHDAKDRWSNIDLNRAGTPLIEIVTEPDIRNAEEAFAFVTAIRKLVRYLDVCDGNMEEGSLRCDVNISVRKKGDPVLGTRVEVKNLNSIRHVKKAVEVESARLIDILKKGKIVKQETRTFDAANDSTFAIREKEEADDYRYFADPDLTPFILSEEYITSIRNSLPELPQEKLMRYSTVFGLSAYDAAQLSEERLFAEYFDSIATYSKNYKAAANWMLGPVRTWLNESGKEIADFPIAASRIAELIELIDQAKISYSIAATRLWNLMLVERDLSPQDIAISHNLLLQSNSDEIELIIDEVLEKMRAKVEEYRKGKKGLLALFVGEVMKQSKGKADPKIVNEILNNKLKS